MSENIRMSYYAAGSGDLIVECGFQDVATAKIEGARRVKLGVVDMSGFGILIDEDDAHSIYSWKPYTGGWMDR